MFSALLHDEAITIAQLRVPETTDETTQVKTLLGEVDLTGLVVTGEAAHAQHATAAHIATERGGHYALTVKANQPGLLTRIADALPPAVPGTEHHAETDTSKGPIVRRAIWVVPARGVEFPGAA